MLWDLSYEQLIESFNKSIETTTETEPARATSPYHQTYSGILSHAIGTIGLLCIGNFSSVLAPPARISVMTYCKQAFKATTWKQYAKAAKWFFN